MKIIIIVIISFFLLFLFCSLKVASKSDEKIEDISKKEKI